MSRISIAMHNTVVYPVLFGQQSAEIARRKARVREAPTAENTTKLQHSESRMIELKATMAVLGKEAVAALAAVESQQKRVTLQRLVGMVRLFSSSYGSSICIGSFDLIFSYTWSLTLLKVEAEKLFYLRLASILDDVEAEVEFLPACYVKLSYLVVLTIIYCSS
jgi:hypothetical protein